MLCRRFDNDPTKNPTVFNNIAPKKDGDSVLIEGMLACCNSHEFEVRIAGEVKYGLFSKMHALPADDRIALEVRCKKCGKVISVFDSSQDGYDNCENKYGASAVMKPLVCKKCSDDVFAVFVKYEYPDIQELENLVISKKDNAFTWIWITLRCCFCGTRYSDFIDCETTSYV